MIFFFSSSSSSPPPPPSSSSPPSCAPPPRLSARYHVRPKLGKSPSVCPEAELHLGRSCAVPQRRETKQNEDQEKLTTLDCCFTCTMDSALET
ncbi:unnamed protein product [Pleuronectes platessa]|uniref:Uncharacterized protein n=1 Tax=Pleuronectes platessa TaxID=8262 RepID=A0A9N7VQU4_PLEPL|nr:unnamed protein product [Pleuronectes platessa]